MTELMRNQVQAFLESHPELDEVEVLATDLCGHYFGKRYPVDKLDLFAREGLALPASMFVLSTLGEPLEGIRYGIEDGDPDAHFYLVPGSLCVNHWGNRPRGQVLASTWGGESPNRFEPRCILQRVCAAFAERGWHPVTAFELEFYLFDGKRDANDRIQVVRNPKTGRNDSATVLSLSLIHI